jgi:universal stress protein A
MPDTRRILAAVDFSPSTADVVAAAEAFALAHDATLDLLHVLPLRETDSREAQKQLDAVPAGRARVGSRRVTRAITSELGILEAAKEARADLVVVGTHGRTGLPHILLGSVAARVVELAPVPVLAVRRPASRAAS